MRPIGVPDTDYVAKAAARSVDLFVPFVDFMYQRASWPELDVRAAAIRDDIHNLFTSVAKLRHIHRTREGVDPTTVTRFAQTEIEYVLTTARSVFDLVQEMLSIAWFNFVKLNDPAAEARRKKNRLPTTFSRMCLRNKTELLSAQEIFDTYGLPTPVAEEYERNGAFFTALRSSRDRVVHGLGSPPTIFSTPKGFAVFADMPPFDVFEWKEHHQVNEQLVALLPWLAHVFMGTVDACSGLVLALATQVTFPPEIAPG